MEFLKIDESDSYQSNILNRELIRTGSSNDGSCFFYSIFYPFQFFRKLSVPERSEYIGNKRREIAERIDLNGWFSLQNGNIAFLQITQALNKIIHSIPRVLYENHDYLTQNNLDLLSLEILFTLLNPTTIEKEILPTWDIKCSQINENQAESMLGIIKKEWCKLYEQKIREKINNIEKNLNKNIDKMTDQKKEAVIQKLANISNIIFDFVANYALDEFKTEIRDPTRWINIFILHGVIINIDLKMNIIFIDSETGSLYEGMKLYYKKEMFSNDNPFVLLLYFKQMHFECLGRKYIQNNKMYINRLFKKDDPIVMTCLSYLDADY